MEAKGLYQRGLLLRSQRRYREAGECFRQAAEMGNGDACWEMYSIFVNMGGSGIMFNNAYPLIEGELYLLKGSNAGNQLCQAMLYLQGKISKPCLTETAAIAFYSTFKTQTSMAGDLPDNASVWDYYFVGRICLRAKNNEKAKSYITLAAKAGLPEAQNFLFDYPRWKDPSFLIESMRQCNLTGAIQFLSQPNLVISATPEDIAHGLYIVDYHDDIFAKILTHNLYRFSGEKILEIRCRLGFYYEKDATDLNLYDPTQFEAEEFQCLQIALACRRRARAAATAWLLCRRHGRLPGISRDTARLVAERILAEPLKFLGL